ncbi:MAG: hypothetical protein D6730_25595 [Bacteroidetes bacterium]|nr:MAG: hypothetical protein D6730_25595 [Bacteroidota bacterium]
MYPFHIYGLLAAFSVVLSLSACVYNNEEELYPQTNPPADTCGITSVSYSRDVVPILQNNCYSCHSSANAPGLGSGIVLEGYANAKTLADNGRLKGAIEWEAGFSRMPRGGAQLPECLRKTITTWIANGSPNN